MNRAAGLLAFGFALLVAASPCAAQDSIAFASRAPASDEFAPPAAPAPDGAPVGEAAPSPRVEDALSLEYGKTAFHDYVDIAAAPWHWDRDDWRTLGTIGLGLALSIAVLDKPVRDFAQKNRSDSFDNFITALEPFGTKQYAIPLFVGFYAYGKLDDDGEAKATALDGVAASFVSGSVTGLFKGVFGRDRPNTGNGPHSWHPFNGGASFPSGHATQAFATAGVITEHYPQPWVAGVSYGVAGVVAYARVYHDKHWLSDVVAGGFVGTLTGRELVRFNGRRRADRSALVPDIGTDGQELTLDWRY